MQNSDDTAYLEIFFFFFCTLFSLYLPSIPILSPPKNAHEDRMLLVLKIWEHYGHLGQRFLLNALIYLLLLRNNLCVSAMQCLFYCKKVWCSAKLRYYFFVCVCCVLRPSSFSPSGQKKSFYVFVLLRMLWCFELMKIACLSKKTREEEKQEERMQVGFTWHFAI